VLWVIVAAAAGALWAGYVYLGRERLGGHGVGLSLLRAIALAVTVGLFVNASAWRAVPAEPATVLLDASLSMERASLAWSAVVDSVLRLAGAQGRVMRFGDGVAGFDSTPPADGRSAVGEALRAAAGRSGPVFLVSDGELDDFAVLPAELRGRARLVLVPRSSRPGLAVTAVTAPPRVLADDSLAITVELTTWGGLGDTLATLEVLAGARRLARFDVPLPPGDGQGRRTVSVPPGALAPGAHALTIHALAPGDPAVDDNVRLRVVEVTALPALVLVASPPDWETRFLMRELADIAPGGVRGFANLGDRWIDIRTQQPIGPARVRDAARRAAAVVARGASGLGDAAPPSWWWIGGRGSGALDGDWYVGTEAPASPLTARLAGIAWDSLPPVTGVVVGAPSAGQPVLTARLGRRGGQAVVVALRDSAGRRELVTAAEGLWRWAFRGGVAREAYRALLAAGVEWLLGGAEVATTPLTADAVVPRAVPVTFHWSGPPPERPIAVEFRGPDSTFTRPLTLDGEGRERVRLPPGVYRWRAPDVRGGGGLVAVETYSDELVPRPVVAVDTAATTPRAERIGLRGVWWMFGVAMAAFLAEWGWRMRRGLP
jgi:hypothetical protein